MSGQRVVRRTPNEGTEAHEGPKDHGHAHDHDHADHHEHAHEHAHDHPHDHPLDARADPGAAPAPTSAEAKAASKLPWVLALTFSFFVLELAAARYARSDALRADAIHLLADVLAIGIAYTAFRLADRRPSARFTFGLRRIEAVAALLNAVLVLLGAAEIVHEGIASLRGGAEPRTSVMLVVAGAALFVHGLNAALLHRDLHGHHGHGGAHVHHASPHVHVVPSVSLPPSGKSAAGRPSRMSIRGAWLHVLGDALGALCALCAGAAIRFGAPRSVDPIASFFVAALLLVGGLRLVREATLVLLEAAPSHLPIDDLERAVCEVDGVDCVHRLRVWSLGTGYDAVAMHVMASEDEHVGLAAKVEQRLRARFHVDYVCVQVDPPGTHAHPQRVAAIGPGEERP